MSDYTNSFELLIKIITKLGIVIYNESDLRSRLKEVGNWRYAFQTLVCNGTRIGIKFKADDELNDSKLVHTLQKFHFQPAFASQFLQIARTSE